jgi:tetratricopeptide (TPR) repeat protein
MRSRQARDLFNEALSIRDRGTPQDMERAREMFLEAARLEPDSPWPYAYAAVTHALELMNGWTRDRARSLDEARRLALKSCELEQTVAGAYATLGVVALFGDRHDEALAHFERSREMRPMCAGPRAFLSYGQLYSGLWDQAAQNAAEAVELNPVFPLWYRYLMGAARHFSGHHDEGLRILQNVTAANPRVMSARLALIHAEMALGRGEEATAEAAAVLKDRPDFSVRSFAQTQPFRDKALRDRYLESLRIAGLPE